LATIEKKRTAIIALVAALASPAPAECDPQAKRTAEALAQQAAT
jgi:hypothetical protein